MDRLLKRLVRTGFRRALSGDYWAWWVIAGAAWLLTRARRQPDPVAVSSPLKPGDRLHIVLRAAGETPRDGDEVQEADHQVHQVEETSAGG